MCMTTKENFLQLFECNNFSNQLVNNISMIKDNFTCNYFNEISIQKVIKSHNTKSLKIFHLNIRSIKKHKVILKSYLETLNCTFDLIFLTETGSANPSEIENIFQNYKLFIDPPSLKKGVREGQVY